MTSDARKRLAGDAAAEVHHIHPDAGVRALIERERQAAAAEAWDEGKWATYSAEREGRDGSELINPYRFPDAVAKPETRPGAHPGETVCEGCIHGPACRVIPCVDCDKSWHLLGMVGSPPFICPRCEDARYELDGAAQ